MWVMPVHRIGPNYGWWVIMTGIFSNLTIILLRILDDLDCVSVAYNITRNQSQNYNFVTHLPVDAQEYTYVILMAPLTHRLPL
jgi:hypothetical protein